MEFQIRSGLILRQIILLIENQFDGIFETDAKEMRSSSSMKFEKLLDVN